MARSDASLREAAAGIPRLRDEFWQDLRVLGTAQGLNQNLEKAMRVADFLEFAELMVLDALERRESCGGHFREESCTAEGEARRDDGNFSHAAVWEYQGDDKAAALHREPLEFEHIKMAERSYK